jgi:demethylmenaquinone methyltransferase/2-methoxy-6-polyprenyl-1,4-benzoquinol methylase
MDDRQQLATYYSARATEYERIYAKPERQADLATLKQRVASYFEDRTVLEIAAGTGYWTAIIAPRAASVLATDLSAAVLDVARAKSIPAANLRFQIADAFELDRVPGRFDACFAGFWWSHLTRAQIPSFLDGLHRRLEPGARVLILDNRYVEGSSTPIARTDAHGNTYQRRTLDDGTTHEVLKNFPSPAELREQLRAAGGHGVEVTELPYYWYATYEVGRPA